MAATDGRPVPLKNLAFRLTFYILDADGDLVTAASGLDSLVSIDGGTFAACTNEATEIATSSGVYFLDLTAGEMNGDTIAIITKTSSSGAKTSPTVLYPEEAGDIRVNLTQWSGTAPNTLVSGRVDSRPGAMASDVITAATLAADVTTELQSGLATSALTATAAALATVQSDTDNIQTRLPAALVGGRMASDAEAISGDANAGTNLRRSVLGNVICTVGSSSTTTSIVTSSMTPAASVTDQFKGRVLTFERDTATAALRGQGTDITANTAAGVLTVTALTVAPASGDLFTIT